MCLDRQVDKRKINEKRKKRKYFLLLQFYANVKTFIYRSIERQEGKLKFLLGGWKSCLRFGLKEDAIKF